ncbi:hypothetical protein SKAU_G00040380 [Synaphobranchus kaupii]|uniref:Uncharacterized protein n=1 Tax=Synaphobranchus kaupii TaxID=118154 RepID=A0A9Q1J8E5_SYNKA|nr:hypothetical protein SKAU_G00040380 [Synaphobranchus kaupii]
MQRQGDLGSEFVLAWAPAEKKNHRVSTALTGLWAGYQNVPLRRMKGSRAALETARLPGLAAAKPWERETGVAEYYYWRQTGRRAS